MSRNQYRFAKRYCIQFRSYRVVSCMENSLVKFMTWSHMMIFKEIFFFLGSHNKVTWNIWAHLDFAVYPNQTSPALKTAFQGGTFTLNTYSRKNLSLLTQCKRKVMDRQTGFPWWYFSRGGSPRRCRRGSSAKPNLSNEHFHQKNPDPVNSPSKKSSQVSDVAATKGIPVEIF